MNLNISDSQLKILLLFALKLSGGVIPEDALIDITAKSGANPLLIQGLISSLDDDRHLIRYTDDKERYVKISATGLVIADELKKDVPVSIRENVACITAEEIASLRSKISVLADTEVSDNGYKVTVSLSDDGEELMSFSMFSPTKVQADVIAKKFKDNPIETYRKIVSALTE